MQFVKGRLGDRLQESGVLTETQVEVALKEQKRAHRPLGEILVSLGFCGQDDITALIAVDMGVPFLRADEVVPDPLILSTLEIPFIRESLSFPYALKDGRLQLVMVDPGDPEKLSLVRQRFPYPLDVAITTEAELQTLSRDHLQSRSNSLAQVFASVGEDGRDYPVEEIVRAMLEDGIHLGATDVHIEPEERVTRVRFRVDGILRQAENLPVCITSAVISRIKVLSNLNISERRRPQDGRLRVMVDDRAVDTRVSIMPCAYGENVVLRILDTSSNGLNLTDLGIASGHLRVLRTISERPHGIFLVTGPTGSGKTTTLYAMLSEVDAMSRNVATIEDPIEYRVPLLRQSQVDPSIGFGFHEGLRSLLRQDPDVLLIGEIRDRETADMAIKAAMTGHLVLSTLHTNSAVGALPRLEDIGIEPYLIQDSLIGVMAQRLVRRICRACRVQVDLSEEERRWLGPDAAQVWRGAGCERCGGSGYRGRTVIVELFLPNAEIAEAMRSGAGLTELTRVAAKSGFRPMMEDGKRLVLEGRTTCDEVLRVSSAHWLTEDEREII